MTNPFALAADLIDPPTWEPQGRPPLLPHQIAPLGRWDLWILFGGRGAGKTEASSRYFARWMRMHPGHRGRIIAPTLGDAIESCVQGPSGLLSVDPDVRFKPSAPGGAKVEWPNGSEAVLIGTPTPRDVERLRAAGNRHIDWWEELAANPMLADAWDQAEFGLRLGDRPHTIASTTPKNRPKLRELLADDGTVTTHATIHDNPHLDERWKQRVLRRYQGTRLGRQELAGELLEDVVGALWNADMIARAQIPADEVPQLWEVAVAVDPSGGDRDGNDEQGIIVAGRSADDELHVLADRSCKLSPDGWGRRAVQAYVDHDADVLLWEANFGGDMVVAVIHAAAEKMGVTVHTEKVTASRGKRVRAEPVAALYEQGRAHHVPGLDGLEEQQTTWVPEDGWSPDRLDALSMCGHHLMFRPDDIDDLLLSEHEVRISPY